MVGQAKIEEKVCTYQQSSQVIKSTYGKSGIQSKLGVRMQIENKGKDGVVV